MSSYLYLDGMIEEKKSSLDNKSLLIAKEYEDFAYIVSHDLNAPLRHIREFTRLLIDNHSDPISDNDKECIVFLENSLNRLDKMQEALLTFSRLNTKRGEIREVDCNMVVANILTSRKEEIANLKALIQTEQLPYIHADPAQLYTLFFNLIDNAIKFRTSDTDVKVNIGVDDVNDTYIFKIHDNGIGIATEYHQEIFRFFRRLNADKYPGIGAGLSICQKIVQSHGGNIWVEPESGKGTLIHFTTPKR